MARPHGTDAAGRPLDLIGKPLAVRHAPPPQPFIVTTEELTIMAKAESNGTYVLNGRHYKIKAGDPLPEGAEFTAAEAAAETEQRAQQAAPENKSKTSAPENRAKGEK